ncbi:hypothetical protein [Streptomyces radiopugnans]|uniref:ZIP Zinc transporter n=1 Tax=Streptomyces radiopugnans TaxID=403935 RepID=A0A1H9BI25_9ACTN|nr:hypothetical protein [Streptomyces radiopugnans]SEP88273.1 hypothetical protein SAMN05216481_102392 [Streptomyces radiopugnans]
MELSIGESVAASLGIALLLALLHLTAPRIRKLPLVPERATGSFAGGLAVAYVFLHLLPELAEGSEAIGEALSDVLRPTPLTDLGVFTVALAGFTCFYGLERLADRHGGRGARERRDADAGSSVGGGREPGAWVYRLHLGSFLVYNALITYTMALRLRTGVVFALLFTVAMGLHFVLTDRSLEEHYHGRFRRGGRYALAAALLLGWGLSAVLAPTSTLLVSVLTAALAGSILLNVFKEEIPSGRRSSFPWFLAGLVLYAGLLAAVTAVSE